MTFTNQSSFAVTCEWGSHAVDALAAPDVLVVVDVLSFTTAVDVAVARGVTVLPYEFRDDSAEAYAAANDAELAASSRWEKQRYSLAPSSLTSAPSGLRLVLPSPNGSRIAFGARDRGFTVVAGCLRNARAVAAWVSGPGRRIAVVCAGERWPDGSLRPAIEDLIGAGAIIDHLSGDRSPEAHVAVAAFRDASGALLERVRASASGRQLEDRGFAQDVALASDLDDSTCVPVLVGNGFVDAASS